jgi:hypothetical protein
MDTKEIEKHIVLLNEKLKAKDIQGELWNYRRGCDVPCV